MIEKGMSRVLYQSNYNKRNVMISEFVTGYLLYVFITVVNDILNSIVLTISTLTVKTVVQIDVVIDILVKLKLVFLSSLFHKSVKITYFTNEAELTKINYI